jgi:hypothetical protein
MTGKEDEGTGEEGPRSAREESEVTVTVDRTEVCRKPSGESDREFR